MPVEIDSIPDSKAIGWADARLSRLAANSVSLNGALTLTGGTVTTSTPLLNGTQTWNNAGATFRGLQINITDTTSAAASRLLDLQVGGSTMFFVDKTGLARHATQSSSYDIPIFGTSDFVSGVSCFNNTRVGIIANGAGVASFGSAVNNGVILKSDRLFGWSNADINGSADVTLFRDAANTLAQRNGTNAQAFNIYNTYTSASVYERGFMRWASNILTIGTEHLGATGRMLEISSPSEVRVAVAGATRLRVDDAKLFPAAAGGMALGTTALPFTNIFLRPSASLTPTSNGDVTIEFTNDTTITIKGKGSDGTVRSVALTLA